MLRSIFSSRPILLTVSKKYAWNTTRKDIVMPMFIPLLLLFAIFACALWFHDVWFPPEGRGYKKKRNHEPDRVFEAAAVEPLAAQVQKVLEPRA